MEEKEKVNTGEFEPSEETLAEFSDGKGGNE